MELNNLKINLSLGTTFSRTRNLCAQNDCPVKLACQQGKIRTCPMGCLNVRGIKVRPRNTMM